MKTVQAYTNTWEGLAVLSLGPSAVLMAILLAVGMCWLLANNGA